MSSEAPTLSVSYDLRPPSSTSAPPNLSATTTHAIPLQSTPSESGRSSGTYYAALRDAIAEAKDITGRELTAWRDAVGDGEKEKTGGTAEVDQEEPEEEEEEGAKVKER